MEEGRFLRLVESLLPTQSQQHEVGTSLHSCLHLSTHSIIELSTYAYHSSILSGTRAIYKKDTVIALKDLGRSVTIPARSIMPGTCQAE